MALVSEGLGLKEANTASVFLRQLAILLAQALRDEKKKGYTDEHMKGAKAILKHIKKGGQVLYQGVDVEDVALFEKLLQSQRVPYTKIAEVDGKTIFATRDTDKKALERTFEMLADELKVGFKELTPQEFLSENAGREVGHALGYTEAELEIFRKEAVNIGFSYAVVGNEQEKGKYDILYSLRDDVLVRKALKGVAYEMSGPEGREYKEEIARALELKASILAQSKMNRDSTIFIVSEANPMQFITIKEGIMVQHTLSIEEKLGRNGQTKLIVKDQPKRTVPFGNRELTLAMKAYGKCAVVPEEKMSFIDGYDSSKAVVASDATKTVSTLEQVHREIKKGLHPTYEANIGRKGNVKFDKVCTLSDIDPQILMQITREMQKEGFFFTAVSGDFLFKEQDKAQVDAILNRTLYKDMTPLERFQEMLYYEGRIPQIEANEPVYIMSARDPNIVLKFTEKGFLIFQDGKEVASMKKDVDGYEDRVQRLLTNMKDVAVLTEAEMKMSPSEKIALIEERVSTKENEASRQYFKEYKERKEQFLNTKIENMGPDDRAIVKTYTEHEIQTTYVERSFAEKITDMDFGTKMQEREVSTTRTERSSDYER